MTSIAALIHAHNDALRLGRALETLRACHEVFVVDEGATDSTHRIAREYGARWIGPASLSTELETHPCSHVLCLEACESVSEVLEASLYELRLQSLGQELFSVFLKQETAEGWATVSAPQVRLVPKSWAHWSNHLPFVPPHCSQIEIIALEGCLQRFIRP